jgi:S-adenosylmethionine hydrolase
MTLPDLNHRQAVLFNQSKLEQVLAQWMNNKTIEHDLPLDQLEIRYNKKPQFNEQICIAECAFIDGNGNCYFNIKRDELNDFLKQRPFSIKIQHYNGQLFTKIHKQVNDVVSGDALFRFDHLGHLLFQVNQGSAKQLFRIKDDTKIIIELQ